MIESILVLIIICLPPLRCSSRWLKKGKVCQLKKSLSLKKTNLSWRIATILSCDLFIELAHWRTILNFQHFKSFFILSMFHSCWRFRVLSVNLMHGQNTMLNICRVGHLVAILPSMAYSDIFVNSVEILYM